MNEAPSYLISDPCIGQPSPRIVLYVIVACPVWPIWSNIHPAHAGEPPQPLAAFKFTRHSSSFQNDMN